MCVGIPGNPVRNRLRIWDLPTRAFHWALALLVGLAFLTGFVGGNAMVWHGRAGLAIAGLLAFRLVWGFIGSTYARFSQFVRGPAAIRAYLAGRWHGVGHNPLGALSVLGLLAVLAFQVATGLFSNDDIAFNGPLYALVANECSGTLTSLHQLNGWLIGALIGLHIGAIAFYVRVKKVNLVLPMIRGWQERGDSEADSASGGGFIAFVIALLIAAAVVWGASGAWLPAPPPETPAAATPAW